MTVDDDEDEMEVKPVKDTDTAKSTSHKKELSIDIEVKTLKPAVNPSFANSSCTTKVTHNITHKYI